MVVNQLSDCVGIINMLVPVTNPELYLHHLDILSESILAEIILDYDWTERMCLAESTKPKSSLWDSVGCVSAVPACTLFPINPWCSCRETKHSKCQQLSQRTVEARHRKIGSADVRQPLAGTGMLLHPPDCAPLPQTAPSSRGMDSAPPCVKKNPIHTHHRPLLYRLPSSNEASFPGLGKEFRTWCHVLR